MDKTGRIDKFDLILAANAKDPNDYSSDSHRVRSTKVLYRKLHSEKHRKEWLKNIRETVLPYKANVALGDLERKIKKECEANPDLWDADVRAIGLALMTDLILAVATDILMELEKE